MPITRAAGVGVVPMGARRVSRFQVAAGLSGAFSCLLLITLYWVASDLQVTSPVTFYSLWKDEKPFYKLDISWPRSPEMLTGKAFCVAVDHIHGLVYVAQRGDASVPKVIVFSEDGYFLDAWNISIEMPHGIFALNIPNASSVWITDVGHGTDGHTIKQYSRLGELLQVIGTPGEAGSSINPLQLDKPAELYVEPTGDIYIVDGDGGLNSRLLKMTQDLKLIWLHGTYGSAITQFRIPHSVTVDSVGRVWVADRANWRIQVFDKITGEWLGCWSSCFSEDGPYSVRFTPDEKFVIVGHLSANRISILIAPPIGSIGDCAVVDTIQLAPDSEPHLLDVSKKTGAIYVADIGYRQVQKYVPFVMHRKVLASLPTFGLSQFL